MKYILILIFSINVSHAINWIEYENLEYATECSESKSIIVLLHGANVNYETSGIEDIKKGPISSRIIQGWLDHCALVALPHAMILNYDNGNRVDSWDFTGEYSDHKNIEDMKDLMLLADSFNLPVMLVGGSAGALMAYRVASELVNEGTDVIDGLVLLEVVSPYSLSIYAENAIYINPMGIAYHPVEHPLGLYASWNIPTIIGYSVDDNIMPEKFKRKFIAELAIKSRDLQVVQGGFNHLINEYVIGRANAFILERL